MSKINTAVKKMIKGIDQKSLRNNTQRALVALLASGDEWTPRSALEKTIPNVSSRARELRMKDFGGFDVQVKTAHQLNRQDCSPRETFYRIGKSATKTRIAQALTV